jgi:hypothetical protein
MYRRRRSRADEMLKWQTERFLELETHREGHVVHVRPDQVVEIGIVREFPLLRGRPDLSQP